jgi:hypothetical protein
MKGIRKVAKGAAQRAAFKLEKNARRHGVLRAFRK